MDGSAALIDIKQKHSSHSLPLRATLEQSLFSCSPRSPLLPQPLRHFIRDGSLSCFCPFAVSLARELEAGACIQNTDGIDPTLVSVLADTSVLILILQFPFHLCTHRYGFIKEATYPKVCKYLSIPLKVDHSSFTPLPTQHGEIYSFLFFSL